MTTNQRLCDTLHITPHLSNTQGKPPMSHCELWASQRKFGHMVAYRLTNLRVQRVKPPLLSLEYLELAKKTPDLGVLDHADSSQRCFARSFSIAHEIISDFR